MRTFIRCVPVAVLLLSFTSQTSAALEKVKFPALSKHGGKSFQLRGEVFRPRGAGPFPAVVMMHGCGGLPPRTSQALSKHASHLVAHGFIALKLDSFGPRGFADRAVCKDRAESRAAGLYRVQDAMDALAFLATRADVDRRNIFQMGQSNGAGVSLRIADGKNAVPGASPEHQFRAVVAYYPGCGNRSGGINLAIPLLVFSGGRDDWAPAKPCEEMKASGAEYQFVKYANAAHSFDLEIPERRFLGHLLGGNAPATQDSRKKMVEFLRRHLTPDRQTK
jgi:dienelactone hydrolase